MVMPVRTLQLNRLVLLEMVEVLLKPEEALLGTQALGLVNLAKHIIILALVMKMAAEEAAGMAALLVMIMTLIMMVVAVAAAQDMFIPLEQPLIILPDAY